jgi:hypothetical protein
MTIKSLAIIAASLVLPVSFSAAFGQSQTLERQPIMLHRTRRWRSSFGTQPA